ncbi:MAG TPA: ABC transporter permease, partial [Alcaligenes sp.]|nr:ABC transporter permease [Alcaligenes sp.]HRL27831.1 ABC transporter permease [Alcaligenes sp.]
MKLFSLAFRSLLRNRRRSLMTLSAMVVGLAAMLIFGGYARNAVLATQTGYVQFQGHLQIQRKGYFLYGTGNPSAYGISRYQDIIKAIQSDPLLQPMIKVITPTLQLQGIAGNFASGVSKGVVATGVDAKDQNLMRKWDDYDGQIFAPTIALEGKPADSAVVGTGVAHLLQLCTALQLSDCPSAQDVGGETQRKPQGPDAPT